MEGERREELRRRLLALGFDDVRFAAVSPAGGVALQTWLSDGRQGEMAWMDRTAEKRADATQVLPGARSVVVLGVNYFSSAGGHRAGSPRWARYVLHEDYHDTIKPALVAAGKILEEFSAIGPADYRYYVDTGPVMERGWAARAGVGFRGKNGMLISRRHGNWLFLATLVTRAAIAADEPVRRRMGAGADEPAGLLCGKCTRCIEVCPTAAIPEPGLVDSRRCISYQTIENKGFIPRELRPGIGDRVYGCDACLEVCPWNRFAREGRQLLLASRHDIARVGFGELLEMTPERFAAIFRRTAIKRLKLAGLLRNACIVAGNSGDRTLLAALMKLARHESPLVRGHAVWAVRRLADAEAESLLAAAKAAETDATVLAEYEGD